MRTLVRNDETVYCIGSRTGILVRGAPAQKRGYQFDQDNAGLHHICFRARSRNDVEAIGRFVENELGATMIESAADRSQFAPGYYSILFEDPGGLRIEFNFVPGKGHFGDGGRLGDGGVGVANHYGADGLRNV